MVLMQGPTREPLPAAGLSDENGKKKYRKPDGTFITNGWLNADEETYYMDENGYMLTDTITPDGDYVKCEW